MNPAKTSGRTFIPDKITHAIIVKDQVAVFPVDYHQVILTSAEKERMIEALLAAGFVGNDTLINPARVSVVEEHGANVRMTLEGADRVLYLPASFADLLFPAPESITSKPRRAKKEAG